MIALSFSDAIYLQLHEFFSNHLRGFDDIQSRKAFWYTNHSVTLESLSENKGALFIAKFEIKKKRERKTITWCNVYNQKSKI